MNRRFEKTAAPTRGSAELAQEFKGGFLELLPHPRECFRQLSFEDVYLLLNIYLIPNIMLGFINPWWFYTGSFDYQVFIFAAALPLLLFKPSRKYHKLPGGIFLIMLCMFVVFQAFRSSVFLRIPISEIVACMRYNIWSPLTAFCIVFALSGRTKAQLNNIIVVVIWLFVVQMCLASLSTLTTYDFFISKRIKDVDFVLSLEGVRGNTTVYPKSAILFAAVVVLISCIRREQKWFWISCLAVAMPLLYTMRSQTVRAVIAVFLAFSLYNIFIKQVFGRVVAAGVILVACAVTVPIIMPGYYDKVVHKFRLSDETEDFTEISNYQFRTELIELALINLNASRNRVWGMGYQRDYDETKREGYSYVLGADAPIASVLFCEGHLGALLRILPYAAFLLFSIGVFFWKTTQYQRFLAIVVISTVSAEAVGWVQTNIITQYTNYFAIFALMYFATLEDPVRSENSRGGRSLARGRGRSELEGQGNEVIQENV